MEDSTKVVSLQIIFGAGPQDCPTRRALESTDRFIIVLTVFVPVASVARGPGKKMAPPLWPARWEPEPNNGGLWQPCILGHSRCRNRHPSPIWLYICQLTWSTGPTSRPSGWMAKSVVSTGRWAVFFWSC